MDMRASGYLSGGWRLHCFYLWDGVKDELHRMI
jgi:hypothetical protein